MRFLFVELNFEITDGKTKGACSDEEPRLSDLVIFEDFEVIQSTAYSS